MTDTFLTQTNKIMFCFLCFFKPPKQALLPIWWRIDEARRKWKPANWGNKNQPTEEIYFYHWQNEHLDWNRCVYGVPYRHESPRTKPTSPPKGKEALSPWQIYLHFSECKGSNFSWVKWHSPTQFVTEPNFSLYYLVFSLFSIYLSSKEMWFLYPDWLIIRDFYVNLQPSCKNKEKNGERQYQLWTVL